MDPDDGYVGAVNRRKADKRGVLGEPTYEPPKRQRRYGAFLAVLMLFGAAAVALITLPSETEAFTPHDPIYISGDSDFSDGDDDGVTGGTGTFSDPYVIDGWSISAGAAHGIHILNTNVYFVIANVSISHDEYNYNNYHGVYLYNADNGRVENCNITGWVKRGVLVESSSDIKINDNTIGNHASIGNDRYGVYIDTCSGSLRVERNNVSEANYGIFVKLSNGALIEDNNITGTIRGGIVPSSSKYAVIERNTMTQGGVMVLGYAIADFNSHKLNDNYVNGKEVRYVKNASGFAFTAEDLGQVILANCSDVTLAEMEFVDVAAGINLGHCNDTTISNCECTDNGWYGILTSYSRNVTAVESTFAGCSAGVFAYVGNSLHFERCAFTGSENWGLYAYLVSELSVTQSTIAENDYPSHVTYGILYVSSSSSVDQDSYITYNVIRDNYYGIVLQNVGGVHVNHNDFVNNTVHANDTASTENYWDDGVEGNFWDNYTGPDEDPPIGIGDDPFKIDDGSYDYYPLVDQVIPEFGDVVIPVTSMIVLFAILTARKRKQRTR
jgi:parallel beta-helix repeat protein